MKQHIVPTRLGLALAALGGGARCARCGGHRLWELGLWQRISVTPRASLPTCLGIGMALAARQCATSFPGRPVGRRLRPVGLLVGVATVCTLQVSSCDTR